MAKNKKVVKYKRPLNINIGVIIFIIIFIYIVFNIFSYFTSNRVSIYEVSQGTIVENNTYNGLILRRETVYNSDYTGEVNYYLGDATKASTKTLVYSVDEAGDIASQINAVDTSDISLDDESFANLRTTMDAYISTYTSNSFYNVYAFKDTMDAQLMEAINKNALDAITEAGDSATFHQVYSPEPGIVAYYTDGYESVTSDTFTPDMLNALNYTKNNLKLKLSVNAGDPVYKAATSEDWNIIIPVDKAIHDKLADDNVVEIKFKKDNTTCWAYYTFREIDGAYYMVLALRSNMIRFMNDRYAEIELLIDEESGLKIPNTAITSKEFFVVPKTYFLKGGDSNDLGLLVKDAAGATTFVSTTIYYADDDNYYIDEEELSSGTTVQKADSTETYVIKDTGSLEGVYNVNKGYAVFKQIDIIYQNEEYTIVRTGTDYGLTLYDHIALEGNKVNENDLIN